MLLATMLVFDKYEPDAFEDWYIRAVLADEPPDRLAKARKRFAAAGGATAVFDDAIRLKRQLDAARRAGTSARRPACSTAASSGQPGRASP